MPPLEKSLEETFVRRMKRLGALCPKGEGLGYGYPDRIVLAKEGRTAFVELKRRRSRPRLAQRAVHRKLRLRGFAVFVVDAPDQIKEVEDWVRGGV